MVLALQPWYSSTYHARYVRSTLPGTRSTCTYHTRVRYFFVVPMVGTTRVPWHQSYMCTYTCVRTYVHVYYNVMSQLDVRTYVRTYHWYVSTSTCTSTYHGTCVRTRVLPMVEYSRNVRTYVRTRVRTMVHVYSSTMWYSTRVLPWYHMVRRF
jgi:hypothetical protein